MKKLDAKPLPSDIPCSDKSIWPPPPTKTLTKQPVTRRVKGKWRQRVYFSVLFSIVCFVIEVFRQMPIYGNGWYDIFSWQKILTGFVVSFFLGWCLSFLQINFSSRKN